MDKLEPRDGVRAVSRTEWSRYAGVLFLARDPSAGFCLKPAGAFCRRAPPAVVFCKQQPSYDVQWHGMKELPDKKHPGRRF
jgi:hypothetical protein